MSRDAFLGGRLHLTQPDRGFRSGSDAVLLAAAVPAAPGDSVLDLGCGTGAAMYCLGARVPNLRLTGVERDRTAADLARGNGPAEVALADVLDLPPGLRRQWSHVVANPPYFAAGGGSPAGDAARDLAMREATPGDLSRWVEVACRRVAPKGTVTFIIRAERLCDVLAPMRDMLGALSIRPIAARSEAVAGRVIVQGRLGARGPLQLLAPLILHSGRDDGGYTAEAETILRKMGALRMRANSHTASR